VSKSKKARGGADQRDPHFAREARKYDNPIPSREFILELLDEQGAPLRYEEVAEALHLSDDDQLEALRRRLRAMERDGQLVRNRKDGYCVVNTRDLIAGRIMGHADGFGFLIPDEGGDDLFMSPREMRTLWHGDRIVAQVTGMDRRGRREGAVVEIIERAVHTLVGRIHIDSGVGFLAPDNKRYHHDVIIPQESINGATDGQMVVVELVEQPKQWKQPIGKVSEIIGDHMAPGMETDVAIRAHDLPTDWPDEVEREIASLGTEVPEEAKQGRRDLRKLPLVTIDGADARDFDDAVYCEKTPKGWKLIVCIADVSAYVEPGSALDVEATKRGNSVYFPDRVIPMLPEVLSNGLCSLNPKVDRLCMTAELFIDAEGKVFRSKFCQAVMRSHARLTYDQVGAMLLDGDPELCERHATLLPHLHELYALYQVLHSARAVRGAIDFDTVETRFAFDDHGKLSGIVPVQRHDAHRVIEECMLAANVAAARYLIRTKIPGLFRIHERPSVEKLTDLHQFLGELGLSLRGGLEPTAKDYAELLDRVKDRADGHMIQTVLLRSMMQAVYSAENAGHFGLAFPAYTHFTSPIRRYPDLLVHRAIKHLLTEGEPDTFEYSRPALKNLAEHCSMTERRADEATRDASDALKCEFMLDKVGGTYGGVISGVNSFGVFVDLDDIHITGLVHITALDHDYFHFDPIGHRLSGDRTGKTYRLGDSIEVIVAAVNLDDRKIDLVLANKAGTEKKRSARSRSGSRSSKRRAQRSDGKAGRESKEEVGEGTNSKPPRGSKKTSKKRRGKRQ
jgi:ribonuclease R